MECFLSNIVFDIELMWERKKYQVLLFSEEKRDEKLCVYYVNICVKIELCVLICLNVWGKINGMIYIKLMIIFVFRKVNLGSKDWK